MPTLRPKRRRFVAEYLLDHNATQAAIRTGYAARSAKVTASRLLDNADVQAALREALAAQQQRLELKADDVLRELLRVGLVDPARLVDDGGRLLPVAEMPEDVRRAISSIEVEELFEGRGEARERVGTLRKVKFWDKPKALELLGRHLKLFTDLVEATVTPNLSDEERVARVEALLALGRARRIRTGTGGGP